MEIYQIFGGVLQMLGNFLRCSVRPGIFSLEFGAGCLCICKSEETLGCTFTEDS